MTKTIPIETAELDLKDLIGQLRLGETVTLVSAEGVPQAILVSLKPALSETPTVADWDGRWDAMAHKVSQAWKSEKTALEILAEMRR